MQKLNYLNMILAISFIFLISACNSKIKAGQGVGYYISSKSTSSPIQNIKYICGEHKGTTDLNGEFIYTINQNCTFYLGEKEVGSISSERLNKTLNDTNNKVVEENILFNRILQVVDNDGYPDNGIKITKEVLEKLENKILPTSTSQLITLSRQIRSGKEINSLSEEYIPNDNEIKTQLHKIYEDIKLENRAKNLKIITSFTYYGDFKENQTNSYSSIALSFKPDTVQFQEETIIDNTTQDVKNLSTYILVGSSWKEHNKDSSIIVYNYNGNSGLTNFGFKRISIHKLKIIKAYESIDIQGSEIKIKITDKDIKEYTFKSVAEKDFYQLYEKVTNIENLNRVRENSSVIIGQTKSDANITFAEAEGQEKTSGTLMAKNEMIGKWAIKKIGTTNIEAIFIDIDSKHNKHPEFQYFFSKKDKATNDIWKGRAYKSEAHIESLILYEEKVKNQFLVVIE